MWNFLLDNNRFAYLLMVALILFGAYAIIAIPKENAPEVQIPIGVVTTILPGAPALEIESLVTNEIERGLNGRLENVKSITSTSREGVSSVVVEFLASADIDESISDLKDVVDTIAPNLPADATDPTVSEINFVDSPILTFGIAGDLTDSEFTTLADDITKELEGINGVSRVSFSGIREREFSIIINPSALAQYNLTISEVLQGLRGANAALPIGQIVTDDISYNIAFLSRLDSASDISNIPLTTRGGQPVYVRDIAIVIDGLAPGTTISRVSEDGQPSERSIVGQVFKQRGGDVGQITALVNTRLAELQTTNPTLESLSLYAISDTGKDNRDELWSLTKSGLQTVVFVMIVLLITIGWREALIAGVAIPLSFTIGFIGLYLSGNTINFISLFALILGVGILVDSGIVMVEGINKRMKDNPNIDKTDAARQTITAYNTPLIAGTLTTVSMFVGLFVVSGVTGQFIASIPFTLIFILFASLIVALGFLPLVAATFLRRRSNTKLEQQQVLAARKFENWYRKHLAAILISRRKKVVFVSSIIVGFVTSVLLIPFGLVSVVFFEQSDVPFVFIDVELPEGTTKETTDLVVRQVEELLYRETVMVAGFSTTVGAGNAFADGGQNEKLASILINLREDRPQTSTLWIEDMRRTLPTIPGATITISEPNNGPPTGSPIGIKISGEDFSELTATANIIADLLQDIPGTTSVVTSNRNNALEYTLTFDRSRAATLGLSPLSVTETLRTAVFGTEATTITTLTDDIPVVVRLNRNEPEIFDLETARQGTLASIENLLIPTPTGNTVAVAAIAETNIREANTVINHEDQKRVVTVSADTTITGNVREINAELRKQIDALTLSDKVTISIGGENEESDQAFGELFLALIVGIVLMIMVLVLQFNSFRHTFYVLSILPFSLIGILYGLAVTGSALSFPSIMGFIALTGIIVNNSILLIDVMNKRRATIDEPLFTSVLEGAVSRLRPIVLTTITTVAGMIPLLYTDPIWVPLATAIIFGLSFSVIITLILVPIIYLNGPGHVKRTS